jgi:uncharacterized protein YeaO (DUF488 family)
MIKIKHVMDEVETDDGRRIWVEPIGIAKNLREWCKVEHLLCQVAPPKELANWFDEHPTGYDFFRAQYHEWLSRSDYKPALQQLACAAMRENITLLHHGMNPQENSAMALYEYLIELEAYCPPD